MASNGVFSRAALILTFLIGFASSSFISGCPINFEFQNYTILTSQCKGPNYPAKECCTALLEFACPFADEINDATNDCASIMFSYINLYGHYPPGLFASKCKRNKNGLSCPTTNSTSQVDSSGTVAVNHVVPDDREATEAADYPAEYLSLGAVPAQASA